MDEAAEEVVEESRLRRALWYLLLIISLSGVIFYWSFLLNLEDLASLIKTWAPRVMAALLTLFVVKLLIDLTRPLAREAYLRRGGKLVEWKVISKVYTYLIWALAGLVIFTGIFGSLSSLGISLGIIGAGLAFALQQPILSFSGWFLIMVKRPFTIGDRILLTREGIIGDVDDITMFFFVLKEVAGEESQTGKNVIVPNSAVFQGSIVNYTYDTPYIWLSIPVAVTYESDLTLAEKLVYEAAAKVAGGEMEKAARLIKRIAADSVQIDTVHARPVMRVEFADSSINLTARVMCTPKQQQEFRTAIYKEVYRLFSLPENQGKVEFAYPHTELVAHESLRRALRGG